MWYIKPLISNDLEINSYTTAVANNGSVNKVVARLSLSDDYLVVA
jgi:hypothetical protein